MPNQQNNRTSTGIDTVPSSLNNQLTGGTVTTDALNSDHLVYAGTDNVKTVFQAHLRGGYEGFLWVFVPTATVTVAKVLGVENTAINTYVILLDRAMAGVAGANIFYVIGDLKEYGVSNEGGGDGTFDGQVFVQGAFDNQKIELGFKTNLLDVKPFDATGTSYRITENR